MFSGGQLCTWATKHLRRGAWYLDCVATWTHPEEKELRQSLEVPLGKMGFIYPSFHRLLSHLLRR
jgi:hypothetical protein